MSKNNLISKVFNFFLSKRTLTLYTYLLLSTICIAHAQNNYIDTSSSTIQLIIDSDDTFDYLVFMKFGGFTKEDMLPFEENKTMHLSFDEPIDGFYQLIFIKDEKYIVEQFWLQGKHIAIEASTKADTILIDTVKNAPFYYYTMNTMDMYYVLVEDKAGLNEINEFLLSKIKQNYNHLFSMTLADKFIWHNENETDELKKLASLLDNQNQEIKEHMFSIHGMLDKMINAESVNFDDFKFIDEDLKEVNILPQANNWYLLDFWATFCAPCIKDHKTIEEELSTFEKLGVEVIGISTEYKRDKWTEFIKKRDYPWANLKEINEDENRLSHYIGVYGMPTYLVVNSNGEILHRGHLIEETITFIKTAKAIE